MLAISDDEGIYLLEFVDRLGLERKIEKLCIKKKAIIVPGLSGPIDSIKIELDLYFSGKLKKFKSPVHVIGSFFQKSVWHELTNIPYGEIKSYLQQALAVGNPKAVRAVANANGANQLAIVIPCHRIIKSSGELGGYGGGLKKKKWLIEHEKTIKECN